MRLSRNPNLTTKEIYSAPEKQFELPFTGVMPQSHSGVINGKITSLPLINLATCTREQVQEYFDNTWLLTEVLFSGLATEECLYSAPYHQLRHPLAFYYGHTAAVYLNKLQLAGFLAEPLSAKLQALFETGVDEMTWDVMEKNDDVWPSVEEMVHLRKQTYTFVSELIASSAELALGHEPITQSNPLWALFMGFEHERIHLETSSILIRELPAAWLRRPQLWPTDAPGKEAAIAEVGVHFPHLKLKAFSSSAVEIGKPTNYPSFGWDNEYGHDKRWVNDFEVSTSLISNGLFLQFVEEGGYREERFWSKTGWMWRSYRNSKWPAFWLADGPAGSHHYKLRTTFEVVPMKWDWPALVNFHEAQAFTAWLSEHGKQRFRLPTEAELALIRPPTDHVLTKSGVKMASKGLNLNLAYGSVGPVNAYDGDVQGLFDLSGNLWTWCEDHFHPLQNTEVHPAYEDFSGPCYDGEHAMILGGSFIATGDEASRYARFHFRPHFLQAAGIRVVKAQGDGCVQRVTAKDSTDKYDDNSVLASYLDLHYGEKQTAQDLPEAFRGGVGFPSRCAALLVNAAKEHNLTLKAVLDLGCATGRSSFDIALQTGAHVTAIDLSQPFIDACQTLQANKEMAYEVAVQGDLIEKRVARVPEGVDPSQLTFIAGDATNVPQHLRGCDGVLMANLIDRLTDPTACVMSLGGENAIVAVGGIVVLTSPYTWMSQFSEKSAWLGGYEKDGEPVYTFDTLKRVFFEAGFELLSASDEPLIIREHQRKYELVIAHATVWRRVR